MAATVFNTNNITLNPPEMKSWYNERLQIVVDEEADMVVTSILRWAYKFIDPNGNTINWQAFEEGRNAGGTEIYEKLIYNGPTKPVWIPDAIILE